MRLVVRIFIGLFAVCLPAILARAVPDGLGCWRRDWFAQVLPDRSGGEGCNLHLQTIELMQIAVPTNTPNCFPMVWLERNLAGRPATGMSFPKVIRFAWTMTTMTTKLDR